MSKEHSSEAMGITLSAFLMALAWLAVGASGHKILLMPLPTRSHVFSFHVIARELERQGHAVHMILEKSYRIPRAFAENTSVVFHLSGEDNKEEGEVVNFDREAIEFVQAMMTSNLDSNFFLEKMRSFNKLVARDVLQFSEDMIRRLEKIKFDVMLVDLLFFMKFNVLVAHRLGVPMIVYSDSLDPWQIRTPWFPSIFNPFGGLGRTGTFFARLANAATYLADGLFPIIPPLEGAVLEKYRKYGHFEDENDLIRNASLFLWPKDTAIDSLPPYTANVIPVGGLTIEFTSTLGLGSELPGEFKDFVEDPNSKGTIVVSFGSMVKTYPEKIARLFADTFRRFPLYKFVWRYQNDHESVKLSWNVKAANWLPQKELLGHPSVELFITHAGNNGQFEAIYFGVPMLSIPLFGDQPSNARRTVERGYGESLSLNAMTVDSLVKTIEKILNDPEYKKRTSKASKIFRSQKETPAQRAAYWINHVIEFGGDHLRPIGNDLNLFQYLCLDVLIFFLVCVVGILTAVILLVKKMLKVLGLKRITSTKGSSADS